MIAEVLTVAEIFAGTREGSVILIKFVIQGRAARPALARHWAGIRVVTLQMAAAVHFLAVRVLIRERAHQHFFTTSS